jgi:hypothetical protein
LNDSNDNHRVYDRLLDVPPYSRSLPTAPRQDRTVASFPTDLSGYRKKQEAIAERREHPSPKKVPKSPIPKPVDRNSSVLDPWVVRQQNLWMENRQRLTAAMEESKRKEEAELKQWCTASFLHSKTDFRERIDCRFQKIGYFRSTRRIRRSFDRVRISEDTEKY